MSEESAARVWAKLDELDRKMTRVETMLCERCEARGAALEKLKEQVDRLRISQAKVIGAAALLSVVIGYVLKGLGLK